MGKLIQDKKFRFPCIKSVSDYCGNTSNSNKSGNGGGMLGTDLDFFENEIERLKSQLQNMKSTINSNPEITAENENLEKDLRKALEIS